MFEPLQLQPGETYHHLVPYFTNEGESPDDENKTQHIIRGMSQTSVRLMLWLPTDATDKGHISLYLPPRNIGEEHTYINFAPNTNETGCISCIEYSICCHEPPAINSYDDDQNNNRRAHADHVIEIKNMNIEKMYERFDLQQSVKWCVLGDLRVFTCNNYVPFYYNSKAYIGDLLLAGGLEDKLKNDDSRVACLKNMTGNFCGNQDDSCCYDFRKRMLCLTWMFWDSPSMSTWLCKSMMKMAVAFGLLVGIVEYLDNTYFHDQLTLQEVAEWAAFIGGLGLLGAALYTAIKSLITKDEAMFSSELIQKIHQAASNKNVDDINYFISNKNELVNTHFLMFSVNSEDSENQNQIPTQLIRV